MRVLELIAVVTVGSFGIFAVVMGLVWTVAIFLTREEREEP